MKDFIDFDTLYELCAAVISTGSKDFTIVELLPELFGGVLFSSGSNAFTNPDMSGEI